MTRIARGRATPPRGPATRRYTGCVPACSAGGGPMNAAGISSWPTRFPSVRPDDLRPCAVVARSEHGVAVRAAVSGMTWRTSQCSTIRPATMSIPAYSSSPARSGGSADHMVTVGKTPLELDPLPGVVLRHPDEVIDERLLAYLPSATSGLCWM